MNQPKQKPFQTLANRIAWFCPWYSVRQVELREEIGGTAAGLEYVIRSYPANGIC
jgi:hypothetical protein